MTSAVQPVPVTPETGPKSRDTPLRNRTLYIILGTVGGVLFLAVVSAVTVVLVVTLTRSHCKKKDTEDQTRRNGT